MNKKNKSNNSATLLIHCADQKGLVAAITEFIFKNNGNIIHLDQHVEPMNKIFFMRVEWDLNKFLIPKRKIKDFFKIQIANKYNMSFELHFSSKVPNVAIFVSCQSHCLNDLLSRYQSNELDIKIPLIISNHLELEPIAKSHSINYYYFPITKENKINQEKKQIDLLKKYKIDLIVLARYMQILTDNFVSKYSNKIINIHHSFLPAFPGAKPYHNAYKRGVKIIGATSHYVSEELDAGPIIEQDIVRVTPKDSVDDFMRKGRDLEKVVLSRAIWNHINRKILVFNNRTVIF